MLENIFKHFITITRHRHLVMKMAFKCHMFYQGLTHDLSKYSFIEFYNSCKYYSGTKSPIGNERYDKGYSLIYLHHKAYNKHHFEYWYDPYSINGHISMPDKYILESVLDRIAAAKVYQNNNYTNASAYDYFLNDKITSLMDLNEYNKFNYLLLFLKENGEDKLLNHIKELYKRKYIFDK